MYTGLLWIDPEPRSELPERVDRAACFYQHKFGMRPTICFVHPSVLSRFPTNMHGIELRPNRAFHPEHIWLGIKK
jgi:hypothetical protein